MSQQIPLLSFCIPTYRQPERIKTLLATIVPEMTDDVEIVIQDDSSDDETQRVVREIRPPATLIYSRGEKKGVDAALLLLLSRARGKYVWWFGDDELEPGALQRVINCLKEHPEISFLVINSLQKDHFEPDFRLGGDHFFRDKNEVIEKIGDLLGFISIIVMERSKAISGIEEAKKYIGSAWVSLFLILHALSQSQHCFYLSHPYVRTIPRDPTKPAWYDGFTVFALNFFRVMNEFSGVFSRRAIRRALSANLKKIWHGILVYRAKGYTHGLGGSHANARALFPLYWSFPQFWIALPLLLLPRAWTPLLYRVYVKLFRRV